MLKMTWLLLHLVCSVWAKKKFTIRFLFANLFVDVLMWTQTVSAAVAELCQRVAIGQSADPLFLKEGNVTFCYSAVTQFVNMKHFTVTSKDFYTWRRPVVNLSVKFLSHPAHGFIQSNWTGGFLAFHPAFQRAFSSLEDILESCLRST